MLGGIRVFTAPTEGSLTARHQTSKLSETTAPIEPFPSSQAVSSTLQPSDLKTHQYVITGRQSYAKRYKIPPAERGKLILKLRFFVNREEMADRDG